MQLWSVVLSDLWSVGNYQKVYEKSKLNNCRLSTGSMIYVDRSTIMYHREGSLVCMGVQTIFVIWGGWLRIIFSILGGSDHFQTFPWGWVKAFSLTYGRGKSWRNWYQVSHKLSKTDQKHPFRGGGGIFNNLKGGSMFCQLYIGRILTIMDQVKMRVHFSSWKILLVWPFFSKSLKFAIENLSISQ